MTDRFNRNNYKILDESEQEEYFNDAKFQALYKKCLDNKDKFIKLIQEINYIRKSITCFNNTTANGIVSIFIDSLCSKILDGVYVDKVGYDILLDGIKISSKALKKMFGKTGTRSIIDSNKIVSSDNYNNDKHEEVINSDCYLLIQTEDKIVVAIAPKKSSRLCYKNTASNTAFVIPNDSYLKYIVSKEDNIQIDNDYISTNENTINLVNTINDYFINYNFD